MIPGSNQRLDLRRGWLTNPEPLRLALHAWCADQYDTTGRWSSYLDSGTPINPEPFMTRLGWPTVALVQAYRDGNAVTDWHDDAHYKRQAILAIGASRPFSIRIASGDYHILLNSGDLLEFDPGLQHAVLWSKAGERFALVFRT